MWNDGEAAAKPQLSGRRMHAFKPPFLSFRMMQCTLTFRQICPVPQHDDPSPFRAGGDGFCTRTHLFWYGSQTLNSSCLGKSLFSCQAATHSSAQPKSVPVPTPRSLNLGQSPRWSLVHGGTLGKARLIIRCHLPTHPDRG
jgi:hypothetical protein